MPLPFLMLAQRREPAAQFASPYAYQAGGRHSLMSAGLALGITAGVGTALVLALVVPTIVKTPEGPLVGTIIRTEPPPPPPDQTEVREQPRPDTQLTMPQPDRELPPIATDPPFTEPFSGEVMPPTPYTGGLTDTGGGTIPDLPPAADPVLTTATRDPRFADRFQPPYPSAQHRAELEGHARVRIRIGADGRVTAIDDLGSTDPAFFAATERQALARWRFRPATRDGVPVESTQVLTVHFRIERNRR